MGSPAKLWLLCIAGNSPHLMRNKLGCQRPARLAEMRLQRGQFITGGKLCFELRRSLCLAFLH